MILGSGLAGYVWRASEQTINLACAALKWPNGQPNRAHVNADRTPCFTIAAHD